MPLPLPRLDNRTFAELVAEGRSLIPRHAPDWTDHNFHDPGITILELLAWLTEMDIYRLDRTVEASYRAFLRMVGVDLSPARMADTVLVFRLESAITPMPLPAGLQVGDVRAETVFQTDSEINVSPAQLISVFTGGQNSLVDKSSDNQTPGKLYQPFAPGAEPGNAIYFGFDRPLAATPIEMSLYVWTASPQSDKRARAQLVAEWEAARDEAQASCPPGIAPDLPGWWLHYSARTVWEYHKGNGEWVALADVTDETRGLTLSGAIRFVAPVDHAPGESDASQYFIRCRLVGGKYECPPEIDLVALNAIPASHRADFEEEELFGLSDGRAGQVFQLSGSQIVPGSTRVRVVLNNVEQGPWHEVLLWDLVGPHDRAYLLNCERGEIVFGNGRVGRVPPTLSEIRASYSEGGGPAGNVAAATLTAPVDGPHNAALVQDWAMVLPALRVEQPFAATGGAAAETLAAAKGRALDALAQQERAVTLADIESLALRAPGLPVARARAIADYHPDLPCFPALGCVTVVVVPRCPCLRPEPGPDLLRAVARYLDRRRTLTTELHVVGPGYTTVIVHARLHVEPHTDAGKVAALAAETLDKFFHPLEGGPDGAGWPVGRDVYRAEVMALLSELPGVAYVDKFGLETEGDSEPRCGNLPICPDNLVVSGPHRIQVIERSGAQCLR